MSEQGKPRYKTGVHPDEKRWELATGGGGRHDRSSAPRHLGPGHIIVRPVATQPGHRPTFLPYTEPDPVMARLQQIQLEHQLLLEDARGLQARLADLIGANKELAVEMAELGCAIEDARK